MKIIDGTEDLSPSALLAREQKWARQYREVSATVREKYAARILQANRVGQLGLRLLQEVEIRFKVWQALASRV